MILLKNLDFLDFAKSPVLIFADTLTTFTGISTARQRPFSPAKGKTFEAIKVGNIAVKIYKREHATAKDKNRQSFEVAYFTSGKRKLRGFVDLGEARREFTIKPNMDLC